MESIIALFVNPATYINGLIGAIFGFLVAPSSFKFLVGVIKWKFSERHWILGKWYLYYYNFESLKTQLFQEEWTIEKSLSGFKVYCIGLESDNIITYKGELSEDKDCISIYLKSNVAGIEEKLFLRFKAGYYKPKRHVMVGVSNALDWDADASVHVALLSQCEMTENEIQEKMRKNILSKEFSIKIHKNE